MLCNNGDRSTGTRVRTDLAADLLLYLYDEPQVTVHRSTLVHLLT